MEECAVHWIYEKILTTSICAKVALHTYGLEAIRGLHPFFSIIVILQTAHNDGQYIPNHNPRVSPDVLDEHIPLFHVIYEQCINLLLGNNKNCEVFHRIYIYRIIYNRMNTTHPYSLYSAQKKVETGNGRIGRSIRDEEGWKEKMEADKARQQAENADYKRRRLAGEEIPQKFFKREAPLKVVAAPTAPGDIPLILIEPPAPTPRTAVAEAIYNSRQLSMPSPEQVRMAREPFHLHLDGHTGNTIFVVGSSKRGKSTAIMKIYDDYFGGADRKFCSILWSANPHATPYKGHSKLIKATWGNGKEGESIIKMEKRINQKTGNEYKFLNIFDDVLHVRGSKLMDNLIMTYRNSKMSTIVSMQYSNMLQKCARANINHVLLFGMNTDEAIEVMVKTYLQGYLKKMGIQKIPDQINWYKAVTNDHGFIYTHPESGIVTLHKLNL
jgi:hypothetical protein